MMVTLETDLRACGGELDLSTGHIPYLERGTLSLASVVRHPGECFQFNGGTERGTCCWRALYATRASTFNSIEGLRYFFVIQSRVTNQIASDILKLVRFGEVVIEAAGIIELVRRWAPLGSLADSASNTRIAAQRTHSICIQYEN